MDMSRPVADRLAEMPRDARLYFSQWMKAADTNIFTAIKDLHKAQDEGSIDRELQPAANLAMVAMNAHLAGDSLPQPKTDDEARREIEERMEQARLNGDRESYDALREALAYSETQAKAHEESRAKRTATIEKSNQALEAEKQTRYEKLLANWKDLEIQKFRRMGMKPDQAERHYQQWAQKGIEDAARKTAGVTPPPIEPDVTGHGMG